MRLEKIVLDGFKSFADRTEFVFDCPVTAIVGPNGCGKSNVVDGVKWVLGEQSPKSLRSGQMVDVIFSGSSGRKPLGSAEVTLFISNPDGVGVGRLLIDSNQIQISRRVYRSGESEYRINNKVCRLKDIRELFMDTGVGTKAYSIIEQGQIEQLLSASPKDRRAVFEEAAGISKYKAHKKEALRKLERTEQNLLRLADILGEVTRRLRSLKLQATKARNYLQYTQRLKELLVNYSLVEYAKNYTQIEEKRTELQGLEQQIQKLAVEVAESDALLSKLGEEKIEAEHKLNQTDNSVVSIQSQIEQRLQRIEFLQTRAKELRQRMNNTTRRIDELKQQRILLEQKLSQHRKELVDSDGLIDEKGQSIEQIQRSIQEKTAECSAIEADLEDDKSGIIDIVRRAAQLHNEIQSISDYRNNLSHQKKRLASQAATAKTELEKLLTERAQCKARLDDIENVLKQLQQVLGSKRNETEEIDKQIEAINKQLTHNKEVRSTLNGEFAALTDMDKRYEGLTPAVKGILLNRSNEDERLDYIEGVLAEIISADVEYANAVDAALQGKADAIVINNTEQLLADTKTINKLDGRVSFLCLDKVEPFEDKKDFSEFTSVKGRLVEFVKTSNKYAPLVWKLLGKTILVDSINEAVELAGKVSDGYTFVTLSGELIGSDGMIKLGPVGKISGLISRKSRLKQLQNTITNITSEVAKLQEQIEQKNHKRVHLEKLCKDLRTAIYEANTEKMQVNSKMTIFEQNIQRLKQEEPLVAGEIDLLQEQIAQSVQKEYESKQKLEELEIVNKQRKERIGQLEAKFSQEKAQLQSQMDILTDSKIALGTVTEQAKALQQIIDSLEHQMQMNTQTGEAAKKEIEDCSGQIESVTRDILNCEAAVSELFVEKENRQKDSQLLYSQIEELLQQQKQAEQLMRLRCSEKNQIEQNVNELRIQISQLEVKQQDLVERVEDELQINLAEAYGDYKEQEVDWDKVKEEILELRGKIERLGNVNLDAITEQESLEERHSFLTSQLEDLNSSKTQLQQLISRLNRKSREKFSITFEQIRGHFQEIFRKLFGGGKADILLEEAEDILEAGIEIIARPPGKETRSISLLSGGEKSLTALALLFAVFRTKPSPFCFLDEVDAALDEANNERFNLLLKEFQKDTQFIIITHAKRTMSISDVLVGITMQTQGVSKKISVRFDEYEEEPAAA